MAAAHRGDRQGAEDERDAGSSSGCSRCYGPSTARTDARRGLHCGVTRTMIDTMSCAHTTEFDDPPGPSPDPDSTGRCADCAAIGSTVWAHLRMCLTCGHVGCCDSSPHRHASPHHGDTGHPVMRSFEPGENWRWGSRTSASSDRGRSGRGRRPRCPGGRRTPRPRPPRGTRRTRRDRRRVGVARAADAGPRAGRRSRRGR